MATVTGYCPKCGVKFNARSASIGTVKHCQACGMKYILKQRPTSAGSVLLVLLLLGGVCYYFIRGRGASPSNDALQEPAISTPHLKLTPEAIADEAEQKRTTG